MPNSIKNNLEILIQSIDKKLATSIQKHLYSIPKIKSEKIALFKDCLRSQQHDKKAFIDTYKLTSVQYNTLKHQLFKDCIAFISSNYKSQSDHSLRYDIIEFEIYLNSGLNEKAIKQLNKIKEIAIEQCDFITCCMVQRKAIDYQVFHNDTKKRELEKASKELVHYHALAQNLNKYELLADEVLNLHFQFLDKRILERDEFLNYLNNDLLTNKNKALSVLAEFLFYRIHSLITLGDNNYTESKEYSLQAINCLRENESPYRNDYYKIIRTINNYLDACLNMNQTAEFEKMFDEFTQQYKENNKLPSRFFQTSYFQFRCSLILNYIWIAKEKTSYHKELPYLEKTFFLYQDEMIPNLKLDILLGFARHYFMNGELTKADEYCKLILSEKTNSASLYLASGILLRGMINYDLGNLKLLPHIARSGKYLLKNRNRLFKLEKCFLNGIKKIKPYDSKISIEKSFEILNNKLQLILKTSDGSAINNKIDITNWVKQKYQTI